MSNQFVKAYNGDPFVGNLSTPISDSAFTRAWIGNLPAYRPGLSPMLRGLEIGMAHGYFVVGPWMNLGPLRDSEHAALGALVAAVGLILIATICLSSYGLAKFQGGMWDSEYDPLQTAKGWSEFAGGFCFGGMGGAFVAYLLLSNLDIVKGMLSAGFN